MIEITIGTTRSGLIVKFPIDQIELLQIQKFLSTWNKEDAIDIWCMAEFLDARFYRRWIVDQLAQYIEKLLDVIGEQRERGSFGVPADRPEALSTNRVAIGETLISPEFRN